MIWPGLAAISLAACGGNSTGSAIPQLATPPALLAPWAAFPIEESPRPIVLVWPGPIGTESIDGKPEAFRDGPSKAAYVIGAIDPPADFPVGPSTADGYPVISASQAFALLKAQSGKNMPGTNPLQRLAVTGVRFGKATFATDRGPKRRPAWLFSVSDANFLTSVLAVAPARQWVPAGLGPADMRAHDLGASISPDQRSLTLHFIGTASGTGPCTSDYTVKVTEYATIVAVSLVEHRHGSGMDVCTLIGYSRTASAVLAAPLSNRVMLDARSGGPVAVTANP